MFQKIKNLFFGNNKKEFIPQIQESHICAPPKLGQFEREEIEACGGGALYKNCVTCNKLMLVNYTV